MIILIDQDDVLADFNQGILARWREKYPDKPYIPLEQLTEFYFHHNYPIESRDQLIEISHAPGFIKSLPPIQGGIEALAEMEELGNDVFICTSPLSHYENCVREKYEWVEEHLGRDWTKKLILTKDKTLVSGDILIDDKSVITGVKKPDWKHILYDKPYNQSVNGKLRITWENWKEVLYSFDIIACLNPH